MCECTCDEMLEPLHYKQTAAYVSVALLLQSASTNENTNLLASQLASSIGPLCPTANCGNRMRILRYLMSPMPSLLTVGLSWDQTPVQSSAIQAVLTAVEGHMDMQHAFKSIPQPATAALRGVLCSAQQSSGGVAFHSFVYEQATSTWHWHGDGTSEALGEEWSTVVSKCSLNKYKPAMLLYQITTSQY